MYLPLHSNKAPLGTMAVSSLLCLIVLSVLSINLLVGQQTLKLDWEKKLINEKGVTEKSLTLVEALDSSAIVAGSTSTINGKRMYVARYDSEGEIEWERILDSDIGARIEDMYLFESHIYIIGNEDFRQADYNPIHYAKLNAEGEVLWHYDLSEEVGFSASGSQIKVKAGTFYILGSDRNSSFGKEYWVAKFNVNGELQWKEPLNSESDVSAYYSMQINNIGQVGIVGHLTDIDASFFTIINEAGEIDGTYPEDISTSNFIFLRSISADSRGNWVITGSRKVGSYGLDATTIKLDPSGEVLWSRNEGGIEVSYGLYGASINNEMTLKCLSITDSLNFLRLMALDSVGDEIWVKDITLNDRTWLMQARVSKNGQIFLLVSSSDEIGLEPTIVRLLKYSLDGKLQSTYELSEESSVVGNISVNDSFIFGCGSSSLSPGQSILLSLSADSLNEVFTASPTGQPYSDRHTLSICPRKNTTWTSSVAIPSDTTRILTVTKLENQEGEIWSINKLIKRSSMYDDFFSLDSDNNSLIFYDSLDTQGDQMITLAKYDPEGKQVFNFVFDSTEQLKASALTTDLENNIYACYYNQENTVLFSKISPDGHLLWTVDYQPPGNVKYFDKLHIIASPENKLVALVNRNFSFGRFRNNIIQFDGQGKLEWDREIGDTLGNTIIHNFQMNQRQDITVWGSRGVTRDPFIYQLNSSGEMSWENQGDGEHLRRNISITQDPEGNTYACFSGTEVRIKKIDSAGNTIKTVEYSVSGHSNLYLPKKINYIKGKVVILGGYESHSTKFTYLLEMVLDDELHLIESRIDSTIVGSITATAIDENNMIYAAILQGDQITSTRGYRRTLLRAYTLPILNVQEEKYTQEFLEVFPNPVRDQIQVSLPLEMPTIQKVALYDMNGRKVMDLNEQLLTPSNQKLKLQLPSQLIPGTYILSIIAPEGHYTAKIVKGHR